jgi:hypothetical protein
MRRRAFLLTMASGGASDTTAPTLTISAVSAVGNIASMRITASEAVTGFEVGDITIVGGSLANFATADNIIYTVDWTLDAGDNTMDIAAEVCEDAAGNKNTAATQCTMTYLVVAPISAFANDTTIQREDPTGNLSANTSLFVGDIAGGAGDHGVRVLIKFDLTAIPAGSYITAATLQMYEHQANDDAGLGTWLINVHRVLRDWVSAQATWNVYSTGNSWGTAGASSITDRVAAASSSLLMDSTAANAFVSWTGLEDDVQGFIDATYPNYGWLLMAPTAEGTGARSYNAFWAADNGILPKMIIIYSDLP